ncbi:MAG: anti-sigma B factor antagonist [Arenicella sp.]|jgi:anti-sigma B factor antagonist
MLDIEHKEKDLVTVVYFIGKIDTKTSPEAQQYVNKLINQGVKNMVINFEKLDFISSTGLRVLLATGKQMKSINGELRVCNLNEIVQEVFDISGFSIILNVFGNESEALDGF